MTLAEFSILVDAPTKWVLNTHALLGLARHYTVEDAQRLALVRILNRDVGVALPRARELAENALQPSAGRHEESGVVRLVVDLPRLRAAIATRLSQLGAHYARRRAGRKPKRASALTAAKRHGLDVSLLQANLARRPVERLRQLDAMVAFRSAVRRVT
jgi:hypothetical protein